MTAGQAQALRVSILALDRAATLYEKVEGMEHAAIVFARELMMHTYDMELAKDAIT